MKDDAQLIDYFNQVRNLKKYVNYMSRVTDETVVLIRMQLNYLFYTEYTFLGLKEEEVILENKLIMENSEEYKIKRVVVPKKGGIFFSNIKDYNMKKLYKYMNDEKNIDNIKIINVPTEFVWEKENFDGFCD